MRSPAARARPTGSSAFSRSAIVGATRLMSNTPSARSATTLGPGTAPGTQARPTSVPAVPSAGSAPAGVRCSCISPPSPFGFRAYGAISSTVGK